MPPLAQLPARSHFTHVKKSQPDADFSQLHPGLWIWHAYDRDVKTELFSTAIATPSGIYLIDPIPLPDLHWATLTRANSIAGIILTNANHQRAALDCSDRFAVPILGQVDTLATIQPSRSADLSAIAANLGVVEISGAVTGEIILHQPANGTLIVGDALINLDSYGFTFLPAKYCLDQKQMRRSLRKLASFSVKRILFAHGTPIVTRASERLRALLEPT